MALTAVVFCLDTSVLIMFLTAEEPKALSEAAARLVLRGLRGARLVAPAWVWAEVGSVLRKKVRQGLLGQSQAAELWDRFGQLPIEFLDSPALRTRAWEIAEQYGLSTLYDAAFLACTEVAAAPGIAERGFWTADANLLRQLGEGRPPYVCELVI
ncbi:MAG: type II toxin-antitoxin system VapC family toxin [Chloroflexota bacterium]